MTRADVWSDCVCVSGVGVAGVAAVVLPVLPSPTAPDPTFHTSVEPHIAVFKFIAHLINLRLVLQMTISCRIAVVMMQYSIMANSYWLLVEGIYLHNLLVITVFTERNYFKIYLCIGWGELSCWARVNVCLCGGVCVHISQRMYGKYVLCDNSLLDRKLSQSR